MTIQSNSSSNTPGNTPGNTMMVLDGRRVTAPCVLRDVAGLAAGWRSRDSGGRPGARRGATLILIIGALALISVVILGYFLIGKADRRGSAVAVRKNNIDGTAKRFADYIATEVIGNDVFSVYVEGKNPDLNPLNQYALPVREAWDYPYTDPQRRSEPPVIPGSATFDRQKFDPRGTIPSSFSPVDGVGNPDKNKVLPFPGSDPWLAPHAPTWLNPGVDAPRFLVSPPDTYDSWLENSRDWSQISDIAPDGRFVNLFNLRNNFDAESGITLSTNGKGARISDNLTLMAPDGQAVYPLGKQELDYSQKYGNGPLIADANNPSHWSTRQQGAFRPVGAAGLRFDNPAFPGYQWVDTDGDGLYDARWCELVDASLPDPNAPNYPNSDKRLPVSLLPLDGRYRWFIAARIVDLSGLINVNVATDTSLLPPPGDPNDPNYGITKDYPIGLSPSDIDLRTALTLINGRQVYSLPDLSDGYMQLPQGAGPNDDYTAYSNDKNNKPVAFTIGASGYQGIAATIGQVLTPTGDQDQTGLLPLTAKARYDYYRLSGGFLQGEAGYDPPNKQGTLTGTFGLPDQIELMTYRGENDPANRSRLEMAVGGRDFNTIFTKFSPLRDNRSLNAERNWFTNNVGQLGFDPNYSERPTGLMWSALDVRQSLTTLSGNRPLRSVRIAYNTTNPLGDTGLRGTVSHLDAATELPTDAVAALGAAEATDPYTLFRGYCDALLPDSADLKAWDPAQLAFRTMAYGYNPETALRVAAAMTANQVDLYDKEDKNGNGIDDGTPHAFTLLLDGSAINRQAVAADTVHFPWWAQGPINQLDLDARLNTPAADPAFPDGDGIHRLTPNVNNNVTTKAINVFGAEAQPFVTAVAVFSMYTDSPTGDKDWGNGKPVTINGTVATNNDDFIMQCVAFQLNNPFDVQIDLTDNYYMEFGTRTIATNKNINIIQLNPNGSQSPVSLAAHETKVFYMLSQPRAQILARMKKVDNAVVPAAVDQWIANQLDIEFGASTPAVQIPSTNNFVQPFAVQQFLAGTPADPNQPANREFRLWRVLRSAVDANGQNKEANDLLVDRIRDPGDTNKRPSLDARLNAANNTVAGTSSQQQGQQDDTGYTITTWGLIARPDDPTDPDTNVVPRGTLPAWCVERKFGSSLNISDKSAQNPAALVKTDFTVPSNPPNTDTTFDGLINAQAPLNGGVNLVASIQTREESKNTNIIPTNKQADNLPYNRLYPEAHIQNAEFKNADGRSILRPADMFLALGVGPWQDPLAAPDDQFDPVHVGWTTLGESLALALGYDNPPNDAGHAPYYDLYRKTDRGSLRLDAFVPFVDNTNNGKFDAGTTDELRGMGIPLALNLFDVFSTMDPQFGSLNRSTIGLLNLNTGTQMTLMALPLVSPPSDPDLLNQHPWFWSQTVPPPPLNEATTDITTTILSYRDKTRISAREALNNRNVSFVGPSGIPGYYNADPAANPPELYGHDVALANYPQNSPTGIQGIREQPGFASKGEVLAARDLQYVTPGTPKPGPHDIDKLGYDKATLPPGQASVNRAGVDSIRYLLNGTDDDQIQDDYDEKLAVANGMMNCASVRSDIFAATFVIHGYQKTDVDGLGPKDPLVPSVARRYLMIVDRSNVVRTGDRPRILVFKELPLN